MVFPERIIVEVECIEEKPGIEDEINRIFMNGRKLWYCNLQGEGNHSTGRCKDIIKLESLGCKRSKQTHKKDIESQNLNKNIPKYFFSGFHKINKNSNVINKKAGWVSGGTVVPPSNCSGFDSH